MMEITSMGWPQYWDSCSYVESR